MELKAFKYYGNKLRITNEINNLIPEHESYYEPFCGSAAVLLNHPRSKVEVINDLDPEISNFFSVLADREKGKELAGRLESLFYEKDEFAKALQAKKARFKSLDDIEKAVATYILISQSFNGLRKSFSKQSYRDSYAYRDDISSNIPFIYERLAGVRVLNMDGIDLIKEVSENEKAFVFADPPYRKELRGVGADKAYGCELPHNEQVRLLRTIRDAKCKIMLCGYRNENGIDLYDTYLLPHGWKSYQLAELTKRCQFKKKKDIGKEFIWINYSLPDTAKYVINLSTEISLGEAV